MAVCFGNNKTKKVVRLTYDKNYTNNTLKISGTYGFVDGGIFKDAPHLWKLYGTISNPQTFESNSIPIPTSKDKLFLWCRKTGNNFDTRLSVLETAQDRSYTITFNAFNRTVTPSSLTTNEKYRLNYVPIPDNSPDFIGWYDEDGNLINENTVFSKNMTVTPKYRENGLMFIAETFLGNVDDNNPIEVSLDYVDGGEESRPVISLQYKTNTMNNWATYSFSSNTGQVITLANRHDYVAFRGASNQNVFTDYSKNGHYNFKISNGYCSVDNDVMYLLSPSATIPSTYPCFRGLFKNCYITTPPKISGTTLSEQCFKEMFYGCGELKEPPALPATTLAKSCYQSMFELCVNLKNPPVLSAATMSSTCYLKMFAKCTNLTSIPDLPSTNLAYYCYSEMFSYCNSLTTIKPLPATTLAEGCYAGMFYSCSNLNSASELPATTLTSSCYYSMFANCINLTVPPVLPAMTLGYNCYGYMFGGCISLTTPPELPAITLAQGCYSQMFSGCKALATLPKLPAKQVDAYCYYYMFDGCSNIKISQSQHDDYNTAYRFPTSGTGVYIGINPTTMMFRNTGGDTVGSGIINKVYYLK